MKKQLVVNLDKKNIFIKDIYNYKSLDLDNENLNFQSSLISGFDLIGVNRIKVFSKNKMSKAGGYFSHYLECNGYNTLSISGKSDKPVFIYINKDSVKIYDATNFFFADYNESKNIIRNIINDDVEICLISLGGAYGVDFSKIMFEKEKSCGKNGLGKIMGKKNLKAIVLKKNKSLRLENEDIITNLNKKISDRLGNTDINSYFNECNNCFGCNINCKSTSLKKLIKKGNSLERAQEIDDICNNYGIDSLIFNQFLKEDESAVELVNKIIKNSQFYKVNNKDEYKENEELDELGFCKFLINKNIIKKEELDILIENINN